MANRIPAASLDPSRDRAAKDTAYAQVSWPVNLAPSSISYQSHGHLLIIGNERDVRMAAQHLLKVGTLGSIALLITAATSIDSACDEELEQAYDATVALPCYQTRHLRLSGHLGAFQAQITLDDASAINLAQACIQRDHFDLVLDLGSSAQLDLQLPPPGYHAIDIESAAYEETLATLIDSVGEFEKPKYFQIDHAICAHAGRGQSGCTRCLDVCPADAIKSVTQRIESWIEIDPYLCHGAGSCTSACPTGAIQYLLPQPQRQLDFVRRLLGVYRHAGGTAPVLRFCDQAWLEKESTTAAPHVLDVPLEELGAAGLEHWLAALADGAAEVRIQHHAGLPESLSRLIDDQLEQARALLSTLGHDPLRVIIIDDSPTARDAPARFACLMPREEPDLAANKRDRLNAVVDHLGSLGQPSSERAPVPAGSPFGTIKVDEAACTLCMACVAVCPTPALRGGDNDSPRLGFREADCVQCGLCDNACPENAITLAPGFLGDLDARNTPRICKEEDAFACINCGKPFATSSTIASIKAKLVDHPYFAGDAIRRLEMCEDCRVKDVWRDLARNPDAQLKI
ncbi:4Fe-4S binding protein [Halomonas sp. M20]|uniref:4Fe-4S binding protein n=1 Tax=Halomonas sp. M20 TaxID=2763264 RepID=UPI001D0A5C37|nr:4Fe-4S dicluster domain-containing protein [Halomonas sp. M20]